MNGFDKDRTILSRDGAVQGTLTGSSHHCRMEGCRGRRVTVKWPDRTITHPCTKGIEVDSNGQLRIV